MERKPTKTFGKALKAHRRELKISLQELGMRIDSDASHIFKIENGHDVTLSTAIKIADALGVNLEFGPYKLKPDPSVKGRPKRQRM
jgi:transcriptional regulator with XRE-family HTH domain